LAEGIVWVNIKKGVQGINFGLAGESFLIINDDALKIAILFSRNTYLTNISHE